MVNLFNIARGVCMPLKIDPRTQRIWLYSRVLVDVDCFKDLSEKICKGRMWAMISLLMCSTSLSRTTIIVGDIGT